MMFTLSELYLSFSAFPVQGTRGETLAAELVDMRRSEDLGGQKVTPT